MKLKIGTTSTCEDCKKEIRYTGKYWEHTGPLQPRHIAKPTLPFSDSDEGDEDVSVSYFVLDDDDGEID
jgi:hypothetical protein